MSRPVPRISTAVVHVGPGATQLGVRQAADLNMERRTDTSVGTLRKAIEAMGGSVEILARFPRTGVWWSLR